MKAGKEVIRFDVELSPEDMAKFEEICNKCYRMRKNFAEALIMLVIKSDGKTLDLTKLGVIK